MKNAIPKTDEEAFERLVSGPKNGFFTKIHIAKVLGISKQAVGKWKTLPVKYVTPVHNKTGIPKAELRPSDFA